MTTRINRALLEGIVSRAAHLLEPPQPVPAAPDPFRAFVEKVARMHYDGDESPDGAQVHDVENDETHETLVGIIEDARALLTMAPAAPRAADRAASTA